MTPLQRRLVLILGWLLVPVVAWAAALGGGWLGAVIGADSESPKVGLYVVVASSIGGGVLGVGGWVYLMWWVVSRGS